MQPDIFQAIQVAPDGTSSALTPYEVLGLIGFATGAALHLYLCWLLYHRYGIRRAEGSLLGLGASIGLWHLGNFAASIHEMIEIEGLTWWLKGANAVAYTALALLPPLLSHAHYRIWSWFDPRAPRRLQRPLIAIGYVPLILLPWAIARMLADPYQPPEARLESFQLPFILWIVAVFINCALIDWRLARKVTMERERRFFEVFGATLAGIGALFLLTYVVGAREWGIFGRYLDLLARLSSLGPTTIIAYYIYRYRYLELVIRQSFVYAILAAIVMMVYLFGIRRVSLALEISYGLRADVIEALLILVLIVLAEPIRRLTNHYLGRLFKREVGLYRGLVSQVGEAAAAYGELSRFIEFAEGKLREALEMGEVRIIPRTELSGEAAAVADEAEERQLTEIEERGVLERLGSLAAYALWREGRVIGLLLVRGEAQTLSAEKREVLSVLAGHIAVAIENCRLLEEKVMLERKLAQRERLASLGQMAATVAHELKNPLSAIKSIAQVMREDESVSREYGRDLELIAGEVDRLNRSVTQLLSFSRPAVVAASSTSLSRIVEQVVALTAAEAEQAGASLEIELEADPVFPGETAPAVQEALINLVINSIQSLKPGRDGRVAIESSTIGAGAIKLSVIDTGEGISRDLQGKIFEPFFTTRQRGTGLGLAIVQRRVIEAGGTVNVTSPVRDGSGTRFDLIFPAPRNTGN
ncbi:MAG: hypothetical protein IPM66_12925 [Acidobacteriota bacterium]|nr:MAG: hypothetical protein IPM66_12925 [Acidobacteriota bacterium]